MNDPTYVKDEIEANPAWDLAFTLSEIQNDLGVAYTEAERDAEALARAITTLLSSEELRRDLSGNTVERFRPMTDHVANFDAFRQLYEELTA